MLFISAEWRVQHQPAAVAQAAAVQRRAQRAAQPAGATHQRSQQPQGKLEGHAGQQVVDQDKCGMRECLQLCSLTAAAAPTSSLRASWKGMLASK
jgi:hypothetical protein